MAIHSMFSWFTMLIKLAIVNSHLNKWIWAIECSEYVLVSLCRCATSERNIMKDNLIVHTNHFLVAQCTPSMCNIKISEDQSMKTHIFAWMINFLFTANMCTCMKQVCNKSCVEMQNHLLIQKKLWVTFRTRSENVQKRSEFYGLAWSHSHDDWWV